MFQINGIFRVLFFIILNCLISSNVLAVEEKDLPDIIHIDGLQNNYITKALKKDYINKEIVASYNPSKFSGTLAKSILSFDIYAKHSKLLSKVTYVLNGDNDHWSHINSVVKNVSYLTIIKNNFRINTENTIYIKSLLDEQNKHAKAIGAYLIDVNDVDRIDVNFHAWFKDNGSLDIVINQIVHREILSY